MASYLPPIGAFSAVGLTKFGTALKTFAGGVINVGVKTIDCAIAYDNAGELHLDVQDISGTRTDSADAAYITMTGKDQSHIEALTPAAAVEIDVDTLKVKSLAIAHDVTFTLAGDVADLSKTVVVYITNGSGSDRTLTFPAAWEWGSDEPNGIADGANGLLVIQTVGTVVTASYALLDVAPDAPKTTSIAVGDSPYTPSPYETIVVDATGGDVTIQPTTAVGYPQSSGFTAMKAEADVSANNIIIDPDTVASETINGAASYSFNTLFMSVDVQALPAGDFRIS